MNKDLVIKILVGIITILVVLLAAVSSSYIKYQDIAEPNLDAVTGEPV